MSSALPSRIPSRHGTWHALRACTTAVLLAFAAPAALGADFTDRPYDTAPGTPVPGGGRGGAPQARVDIADFSVVEVRGTALPNARSGESLGRTRQGGGIVIDDKGLILTIGYLVMETEKIEVIGSGGARVPASLVAYDNATGIGLIRAGAPLNVPAIQFAESEDASVRDPVLVVGFDGVAPAYIVDRREFAGTWEYLLDEALFTAPATTGWSGAALINREGKLLGVGSLLVNDALETTPPVPGNMFVPIDTVKPVLGELEKNGKVAAPPRPWIGVNVQDLKGRLLVTRVSDDGPAARSGIVEGDIIVGLGGEPLKDSAEFYRRLWGSGDAGVEVELDVVKGNEVQKVAVTTMEREKYLRAPASY